MHREHRFQKVNDKDLTLLATSTHQVQKSTFIGYLYVLHNKASVKTIVQQLQQTHKKAAHVCYAYATMVDGVLHGGYSDAKEPKNSAGKPLFSILQKQQLTNKILLVVRYYGGVKLGLGGLSKAYRTTGANTIHNWQSQQNG